MITQTVPVDTRPRGRGAALVQVSAAAPAWSVRSVGVSLVEPPGCALTVSSVVARAIGAADSPGACGLAGAAPDEGAS